jgi:polyhydroxyalkanoate synthase
MMVAMTKTIPGALLRPSNFLDRWTHVQMSPLTRSTSTAGLRLAYTDWVTHLSQNPSEQLALIRKAQEYFVQLARYIPEAAGSSCKPCIEPMVHDRRFLHQGWKTWPFNVWSQSFLLTQQWWQDATTDVRGVSPHHEDVVSFTMRQILDTISPANFVGTNPEVIQRSVESRGANLFQGFQNFIDDLTRLQNHSGPAGIDAFEVGKEVAVTPGKVIFRNQLIELIQYIPIGAKTWSEPILIVPSWIMKYYILDLSPENSLIKYLVDQGHTVFTISWKNPDSDDRDLGMDDYLSLGIMAAIDAVTTIVPDQKVHAVGYCLGGTLLTIAAAAMGRDGDDRLASMSMLAAQTDFSEPGELALFIDESQIAYLEDLMRDKGYLNSQQMAGAFQLMSSSDLVWSRILKDYMLGERAVVSDLMAWSADGTRLPYRMHSEYLRHMFLNNDLADGKYLVSGKPVALTSISCPVYCVGTEHDHVAPWRSVYKINSLTDTEVTFLMTSGGHNVGIVNPPGKPDRSYQVLTKHRQDPALGADDWIEAAPLYEGSWWTDWAAWLKAKSGKKIAAPSMGSVNSGLVVLADAPGTYVMQK